MSGKMGRMNRKVTVRKRFTPLQRADLLADYRASGLTQREFAAQAGISLACLSIWLRREKDAAPAPGKRVSLLEIPSVSLPASFSTPGPSALASSYKVHFVSGLSLEIPRGFSISEARELLNLARSL